MSDSGSNNIMIINWKVLLQTTNNKAIKTLVWEEFIDKKAFRPGTTTTQQPDQIFMLHSADYVNLIVEICSSVFVVKEKSLHSNFSSIS